MEAEHMTALERDRAPLPQRLTGTSHGATSPYQHSGNQSSGMQYYNAKPQEENKNLLEKLREGM